MTDKSRALFGLPRDSRLDNATVVAHIHPEDRPARNAAIKHALQTRGEYVMEYRVLFPDGTTRWIESRGHCVDVGTSKGIRLFGISMDVTAQKQAEAKARKHQEELAHLSRVALMGEMAGALAHELNQPLTGIVKQCQCRPAFHRQRPWGPAETRWAVRSRCGGRAPGG
jgi:PAS domain S-box-containing protein